MMPKKKNSRQKHQKDVSFAETSDEEQNQTIYVGKVCPHLSRGVNFSRIKKNVKWVNNISLCSGCESPSEPQNGLEVWLCLQCGYRGCGRMSNNKHGLQHYKTIHSDCHSLVLSTSSGIVWCYDCDNDVQLQSSSNLRQCVEFIMKYKSSIKDETEKTVNGSKDQIDLDNSESSNKIENEDTKNTKSKNTPVLKKEAISKKRSVKGLRNLGNTCFFNAVMQNLCQTSSLLCELEQSCSPEYRWNVPKLVYTDEGIIEDEESSLLKLPLPRQFSLVNSLFNFVKEMNKPLLAKAEIVNPSTIFGEISKKAPQFSHFQQQDSHELLRQLLENVRQEEIKRQKKAILRIFHLENVHPDDVDDSTRKLFKEYGWYAGHTLVERVFGGLLVSTVLCEECNAASQVVEPFMDLSLPLFEEKPLRSRKFESDSVENGFGEYALVKPVNDSGRLSKHQEKKMKQLAKKEKQKRRKKADVGVSNCEFNFVYNAEANPEKSFPNTDSVSENSEILKETSAVSEDKESELSPVEDNDVVTDSSLKETDEEVSVNIDKFNNEEKKFISNDNSQNRVCDSSIKKHQDFVTDAKQNSQNKNVSFNEINGDSPEKANSETPEKTSFEEVMEDDAKCNQEEFLEKADDESTEKINVELVSNKKILEDLLYNFQNMLNETHLVKNASECPARMNQLESQDEKESFSKDLALDSHKDLSESSVKVVDVKELQNNEVSEESGTLNACSTLDERMQFLSMQAKEVRIRRDSDRQRNILNSSQNNDSSDLLTTACATSKTPINDEDSSESADSWSHALTENQSKEWLLKSLSTLKPRNHISPNECSIQSCLNHFTKPELLTGSNKFRCENCTKEKHKKAGNIKQAVYSNASKQLLIFSPPAILTLHLKRFQQVGMNLRKNNKFVEFPLILNLAPFCSSACLILPQMASVTDEILYSLYGLVEHSGRLTSGHYTAYVKVTQNTSNSIAKNFEYQWPLAQCDFKLLLQKFSQRKAAACNISESVDNDKDYQWYYISDSHVKEVSEATVLNSQAYLLFYERIK